MSDEKWMDMVAMKWQPIATAPRDGSKIPCRWRWSTDWSQLVWKTNPRNGRSYFGDPYEMDDYELADNPPSHWHPLSVHPNDN